MSSPSLPISEAFRNNLDYLLERNYFEATNPSLARVLEEDYPIPRQLTDNPTTLIATQNPNSLTGPPPCVYIRIPHCPPVAQLERDDFLRRNFQIEPVHPSPSLTLAAGLLPNHLFSHPLSNYSHDYLQQQLLAPQSPIMQALGLRGGRLHFDHPFFNIQPHETVADFEEKTRLICDQIQHNKGYWKETLDTYLPLTTQRASPDFSEPLQGYVNPSILDASLFSSQERTQIIQNHFDQYRQRKKSIEIENQRFDFLTKVPDADGKKVQTVPFADKSEVNKSGFMRALGDFGHLMRFRYNRALYPEGCQGSLSDQYLKEHLKGPPGSVGGNFGYFAGSLLLKLACMGLVPQGRERLVTELGISEENLPADEIFRHRLGMIPQISEVFLQEYDLSSFENMKRGVQDAQCDLIYCLKKWSPFVAKEKAEHYREHNYRGRPEGMRAKIEYHLGKIGYVIEFLKKIPSLDFSVPTHSFSQCSDLLVDETHYSHLNQTYESLKPDSQEEFLKSVCQFGNDILVEYIRLHPSLRSDPILPNSGDSAAGFVLGQIIEVESLAEEKAKALQNFQAKGISAHDLGIEVRKALDLAGRTGEIGGSFKKMENDLKSRFI